MFYLSLSAIFQIQDKKAKMSGDDQSYPDIQNKEFLTS